VYIIGGEEVCLAELQAVVTWAKEATILNPENIGHWAFLLVGKVIAQARAPS
jgi:hypothetical protein